MNERKDISIIVAIAKNYAIGKDNQLLWHLPDDLKRFKKITSGNTVIMGKKTWQSLPVRPLPNRQNIVISDDRSDDFQGCITVFSIEEALERCSNTGENFIIGGGSIYRQFFGYASKIYVTLVHKEFEADTFFPDIGSDQWYETERTDMPYDEKIGSSFSYITYHRT